MNFNIAPYYDDFNSSKKFHRILYKPSLAVQTRELTQSQTILQNQIEKFGNHIFKNGAMVIPGHVTFDNTVGYVKLLPTFNGTDVVVNQFIGKKIIGATTGVVAEVVTVADAIDSDPKTLFVKYLSSGSGGYSSFIDGEYISTIEESIIAQTYGVDAVSCTGKCCLASIDTGIYYINGFFVDVERQTIVASKYSGVPNIKIGLRLYELIITSSDDLSLTDNAQGSYNYAANGADRLKLDLKLETIEVDEDNGENFIELQRIERGIVISELRSSEYAELERTFARRTYDESGDYTVSPFPIEIKEHLLDTSTEIYKDGKWILADGGDSNKLSVAFEPGKAYVKGHEFQKISKSWIEIDKARTFETANNTIINFNHGNYIYVTDVYKLPNLGALPTIYLWNATAANGTLPPVANKVGTAKAKLVELIDKSGAPNTYIYKLYLMDINLNSEVDWNTVLYITDSDSSASFSCKTTITTFPYNNMDLMIHEASNKNLGFYVGTDATKRLSDVSYMVQRTYGSIARTDASTYVIQAGTGCTFPAFTGSNYVVMSLDSSPANNGVLTIVNVTLHDGNTRATINVTTDTASSTARIFAPVIKTNLTPRIKTLHKDVQYVISSPNNTPGYKNSLSGADGIKLKNIYMSPNLNTPPTTSHLNVTNRYYFDSGVTEDSYQTCGIRLKNTQPGATGQLLVEFDHFTHSAGDYCSVDSYPLTDMDYAEIGNYSGIPLHDIVDFRPIVGSNGTFGTGIIGEIPYPYSYMSVDSEFYLDRIDKAYMDINGFFLVISGSPSRNPKPPKSPDDGMVLYQLYVPGYTKRPSDVNVKFIENKRYTMRDIGGLEKRIENLEYYTTLSLLEKETAQLQIKDSDGLDRFKNGFIVDPFTSHNLGENIHYDYKCSIDPKMGLMRPTFNSENVDLYFSENPNDSSNVKKTGSLITLPYSNVEFIKQPYASTHENVNPFAVRLYKGNVQFNPESDNWYDTKKSGDIVVNDNTHYDALKFMAEQGKGILGVEWNDWMVTGNSRDVVFDDYHWGNITTTTNKTFSERTGTNTTMSDFYDNKFLGNRTVGIEYIPYMRSLGILIKVEGMKPSTILYPFFDDISVDSYCSPSIVKNVSGVSGTFSTEYGEEEWITTDIPYSGKKTRRENIPSNVPVARIVFLSENQIHAVSWNGLGFASNQKVYGINSGAELTLSEGFNITSNGEQIKSDSQGRVSLVFTIPNPNTSSVKFRTGERSFTLSDQENNTESNQTSAEGIFKSMGSLLNQEGTILSTKSIKFNVDDLKESKVDVSVSRAVAWYDPLAQTFLIDEIGGCFITKCDIFFQKKDSSLPISFHIREVVNGYPGSKVVPYSEVTLYPNKIQTSQNGTIATTFNMSSPVYLQQGVEYCFVLFSDSFDYNVWVGQIGQNNIVDNIVIGKQPYAGVLFKSQNASTWSPDQNQDMKFTLYKARFQTETYEGSGVPLIGNSVFYNYNLPLVNLQSNPIETFIGSSKVVVHQSNHGHTPLSKVTLSGFSSATSYNGFLGSNLNNTFIINKVELDSYEITVTGTGTDSGITGGDDVYSSKNIAYELIHPNISEMILVGTSSSWGIKTCSGKSVAGTQTPYNMDSSYSEITLGENNFFYSPKLVASKINETMFLSDDKSLKFLSQMTSSNRNISPVIDLNRTSAITVSNRIDEPSTTTIDTLSLGVSYKFSTTNGSAVITVSHPSHGMASGSYVDITWSGDIGGIANTNGSGNFIITRLSDDSYSYVAKSLATGSADGEGTITYSTSNRVFIPESKQDKCSTSARYITKEIQLDEPAIAVKILFAASIMNEANVDLYYRKQGPYDINIFEEIEWKKITGPVYPVGAANHLNDFKDYEYHLEFNDSDEFNRIAFKVVMTSTNSTQVPVFNDLRIICLGS